uniref:Uncharacterized protein n=1 Tax=Amphilophus citrinellus TaxID=61819 RepID=A0A3Q0R0H3_AMPCI
QSSTAFLLLFFFFSFFCFYFFLPNWPWQSHPQSNAHLEFLLHISLCYKGADGILQRRKDEVRAHVYTQYDRRNCKYIQ